MNYIPSIPTELRQKKNAILVHQLYALIFLLGNNYNPYWYLYH